MKTILIVSSVLDSHIFNTWSLHVFGMTFVCLIDNIGHFGTPYKRIDIVSCGRIAQLKALGPTVAFSRITETDLQAIASTSKFW